MAPLALYGLSALLAGIGGWWQYNRVKVGDEVVLKQGAGTPIKVSTGEGGNLSSNMPPLIVRVNDNSNSGFIQGVVTGVMNGTQRIALAQLMALTPTDSKFKDTSDLAIRFSKEDIAQNLNPRLF